MIDSNNCIVKKLIIGSSTKEKVFCSFVTIFIYLSGKVVYFSFKGKFHSRSSGFLKWAGTLQSTEQGCLKYVFKKWLSNISVFTTKRFIRMSRLYSKFSVNHASKIQLYFNYFIVFKKLLYKDIFQLFNQTIKFRFQSNYCYEIVYNSSSEQ